MNARDYIVRFYDSDEPDDYTRMEEVVRCKDCVCFISTGYCAEFHHVMPLDGYCSLGKSE